MSILRRNRSFWLIRLALSLLIIVGYEHLLHTTTGRNLEYQLTDYFFTFRGPVAPPDEIVIIGLDTESYTKLDHSPLKAWPRETTARFLKRMAQLNPAVLTLDFSFPGKSEDPETDTAIMEGLEALPSIIGFDVQPRIRMNEKGEPERYNELLQSWEGFESAANHVGVMAVQMSNDVVRHFFVSKDPLYQGRLGMGQQTARLYSPGIELPQSADFINFYGPRNHLTYLPYWQILQRPVEEMRPLIQDKIVLVGLYSSADYIESARDSFETPYHLGTTAGVEIHATVAANILHNNWIRWLPTNYLNTLTRLYVFIASLTILSISPVLGFLAFIGFTLTWLGLSYALFLSNYFLPALTLTGLIFPSVLLFASVYYYAFVSSKFKHVQQVFSGYLSPEMVREIAAGDAPITLGGKRVVGTAMFTDIRGFTSMMEEKDPEHAVRILNQYFSVLAEVIHLHSGSLLKFLGDGMYVIWGAPIEQENHAQHAINAAQSIQEALTALRDAGAEHAFYTRIGIHSGPMLAGNIGANIRYDYTAIGDSVNIAARLEPLNKLFGTTIIISESTKDMSQLSNPMICLGSVRVFGRNNAITIYTPRPGTVSDESFDAWHSLLLEIQSNPEAQDMPPIHSSLSENVFWSTIIDFYRDCVERTNASYTLYEDGSIGLDKI